MRVLVCGGRNFRDKAAVFKALYDLREEHGDLITAIIQGGAPGADALAREWAKHCGLRPWTFEADWQTYGRAAGPIRNQRMLQDTLPHVVLAFPGGKGTADMVQRARAAGVEVREIKP